MTEEIRDRVVRLETNVQHLKSQDEKLERKIMDLEDKILTKLDQHSEMFARIEQYMNKQKGGWQTLATIGAVVVGLVSILSFIIKIN